MKAFKTLATNLIIGSATCSTLATTASAQDRHDLGSAPDVYRIEIRNLNLFQVMETGDNDGTGELGYLSVRLSADDYGQYDERRDSAPTLYNRTRNDAGNNTYVGVSVNDRVVYAGHETNRDLWIHTKRHKKDGLLNQVNLRVSATEYDCAGQRKCNRKSRGSIGVKFEIPDFATPPSTRCEDGNTYLLAPTDGKLSIVGVDNVRVNSNSSHNNSHIIPALTEHKSGGIQVRPYNAQICIASTWRPGAAPPPGYVPSRTTPAMHFIQNKGSDRCLSLPNAPINGQEPPAYVTNCRQRTATDRATKQKWHLIRSAEYNVFSIKSTMGNYCLNLKKSVDDREGGPVKVVGCSGHNDQRWRRIEANGGNYQFKNIATGKCLNVHGREHKNWGTVSVYTCADTPDQVWWSTLDSTAAEVAGWRR